MELLLLTLLGNITCIVSCIIMSSSLCTIWSPHVQIFVETKFLWVLGLSWSIPIGKSVINFNCERIVFALHIMLIVRHYIFLCLYF